MQRMLDRYNKGRSLSRYHLIVISMLLIGIALASPKNALGYSESNYHETTPSCPTAGAVTNQSLLAVLLDRSGSLTYQPGATDPDGYSTSATKALADLWPGSMAVIPFSNEETPIIMANLSDPAQRDRLKQQVERYPIGGTTPLAPAMHKALDLLNNAPSGSRVIIVTDGSPQPAAINNVDQVNDIRNNLLHQFCSEGIPVNPFGLALDLSSTDGQSANQLLQDIAASTGGQYQNVKNSTDLARVVIQLYADWQHLIFKAQDTGKSDYIIPLDTYAKKVTVVTFRASNSSAIVLKAPSGQAIPAQVLQRSTDRHYEIDNLVLSSVNQGGSYSMTMAGDASNSVYTLVETRLHAQLLKPKVQDTAYIGRALDIQAQLLADNTPVVPKPNEATMNANVTFLANGQTASTETVELTQNSNSALFEGHVTLSGPIGQVHVQIVAVYLQIPVEASEAQITIPLEKSAVVVKPNPPPTLPACGTVACYVSRYPALLALPFILLLLLLLIWRTRVGPSGSLTQGHTEELSNVKRPFFSRLFKKSTLSSRELTGAGFSFGEADFDLKFSSAGVRVIARKDVPPVVVRKSTRKQTVLMEERAGIDLDDKDAILAGTSIPAVYREPRDDEDIRHS